MKDRSRKSGAVRVAAMVAALLTVGAAGAGVVAQSGPDEGDSPPPPSGEIAAGRGEAPDLKITTGSTRYDPTILTKYMAAPGFAATQGLDPWADVADYQTGTAPTCVRAESSAPAAAGIYLDLHASLELPDGARIKRVKFYGQNHSAMHAIFVRLQRVRISVPTGAGATTRTNTTIDSFSVPTSLGVTGVMGTDDLMELSGSRLNGAGDAVDHDFHTVFVRMRNAAGNDHVLCGVEVEYQVPVPADAGTVFHPLDGYRAYDSRFEMAPVADGPLAKGANRVVPVKDGRNVGTGVVNQPNAIPATATAVAYTLTVASPTSSGFLWAAPGNVASLNGSSINWDTNTNGALANSGIVKLDAQRRIKVFADGSPGASTHFIIDITGYYAPPEYPNFGN